MKVFLCLMPTNVHHLDEGVFMGKVHIDDTTAPGCMGRDTVIAWHDHFSLIVVFHFHFAIGEILLLATLNKQVQN